MSLDYVYFVEYCIVVIIVFYILYVCFACIVYEHRKLSEVLFSYCFDSNDVCVSKASTLSDEVTS